VIRAKIMVIVHVFIKIKPDMLEPFKAATLKNAQNSIKEPGILRFDFMQQEDKTLSFLLVEVYKDSNAVASFNNRLFINFNSLKSKIEVKIVVL
jgi:quinol monooxygenase YgiN